MTKPVTVSSMQGVLVSALQKLREKNGIVLSIEILLKPYSNETPRIIVLGPRAFVTTMYDTIIMVDVHKVKALAAELSYWQGYDKVYIPYSQFVRVILHYDKTRCGRDDISKEENDLTPEEEARLKELHEAIHEKINQGD